MRARRPSANWTPALGLRNLAVSVAVRTAVVAVAWCGLMALARADALGIVFAGWTGLGVGLIAGIPLGAVLGYRLIEHAGFTGVVVTAAALGGAVVAGILGTAVSDVLAASAPSAGQVTFPAGALGSATGVLLRLLVVEA